MERYFDFARHERRSATLAAQIRWDRGRTWWEALGVTPASRRRHEGLVHTEQGNDNIFVAIWGLHWRERLDTASDKQYWLNLKNDFVVEVCKLWNLRMPIEGYTAQGCTVREGTSSKYQRRDVSAIVLPRPLAMDRLWRKAWRVQIEFVVDNKFLAELANITARITN